MAHYVQIALQDIFPNFLKPDKGWTSVDIPKALEHVFDWPVNGFPGVVVRVWSSIHKVKGVGRKAGADAIRVCAVDTETDKGLVASKRVHRVEGWRGNLKARIIEVLQVAKERAAWKVKAAQAKVVAKATKEAADEKAAQEAPAGFEFPPFKTKKIREWYFRLRLCCDEWFAFKGLEIVYACQTAEEHAHVADVAYDDAVNQEILSSFAEQLAKKRERYGNGARLSVKQTALVTKKMKKYAKQIIRFYEAEGVLATS